MLEVSEGRGKDGTVEGERRTQERDKVSQGEGGCGRGKQGG